MGKKIVVHAGKKYGRLKLIREVVNPDNRYRHCKCKCDCGEVVVKRLDVVVSGQCKSCGCLCDEVRSSSHTTHGYSEHPAYMTWCNIRYRCAPDYYEACDYYDRGIAVCEEWATSPVAFCDWAMENGYKKGLEIDRKNNNLIGDRAYSPENCRWVTRNVNQQNKRSSYLWYAEGKMYQTGREVAEVYGIKSTNVVRRCNSRNFPSFYRKKRYKAKSNEQE